MKRKVLILDTSVLCVWLKVPGKETCGSGYEALTYEAVNKKIEEEKKEGTTFILPVASLIETGNHIAHVSGDRSKLGASFASIIADTANEVSPWAAFTEQSELWKPDKLADLAQRWKETVVSGQSIGDASIVDVAQYYNKLNFEVEIYTGDKGLKSYEPEQSVSHPPVPRRRR